MWKKKEREREREREKVNIGESDMLKKRGPVEECVMAKKGGRVRRSDGGRGREKNENSCLTHFH